MKHSTAAATDNPVLKKIDHVDLLTVVTGGENIRDNRLPLENTFNLLLKRAIDILCSSLLIISVFSWLFPIIALLIKLDSKGPVFFRQKRKKKNEKLFTCIKFRTMIINADADRLPASENDSRITRLGRFLRRHHLDELPQLLNVWWGDMSMIGPRPHMESDNRKYEALLTNYAHRHRIKPGITGLAQVRGHVGVIDSLEDMNDRVMQDIYYIQNWSPFLDMRIACQTLSKMIGK